MLDGEGVQPSECSSVDDLVYAVATQTIPDSPNLKIISSICGTACVYKHPRMIAAAY
jgi:hypothetical protein